MAPCFGSFTGLALWLTPSSPTTSSDLGSLISTLSSKHGTPRFDPHVTLLSGIPSHSSADLPALLASLRTALDHWREQQKQQQPHSAPLRLKFTALGSKASERNYFQYLFAAVSSSNDALLALRAATREALLPADARSQKDDYFPHLSLMYGEDDERKSAGGIMAGLQSEGGEVRLGEGEREGTTTCEVAGHEGIEVKEVQLWRCEGPPEEWECLGSEQL
ncbi:2',3'-cyclic-nucleotide 3'-phosphodiesterase [Rhodotorula diobovata]|uniref:2',3'-cyclic-nucleotide 3'-phosphodiesterase n=1 Tax=Rhodotorula diobovata TaxID=5288 RepID=A0A5C5G0H6_9BASI|nr:2',3'-cyclic-nucleotide 3'-phosphodiesterase [Rhodotorula diobovata]